MNFGSKYVYYYDKSDEEVVSDDSDDGGQTVPPVQRLLSAGARSLSARRRQPSPDMMQHDGLFGEMEDDFCLSEEAPVPEVPAVKKTKKVRKSDPNVFTIDVADYVKPENMHPNNKRLCCTNCSAIMTSFSSYQARDGENNWKCEFCVTVNRNLDVSDFTKPQTNDVTYLLKEPEEEVRKDKLGESHNVIFVIDISGSMGTTKQMDHVGANGRRTRTFVSRLDAVKKASEFQIRQLKNETPNVRVGLVTFGSVVQVYGDGSTAKVTFEHTVLNDQDELKRLCEDLPALKPISETYDNVSQMLDGLQLRGNTALGPGLWSALAIASNIKGSKVIICTDGCANNGIGTLPSSYDATEDEITACREVYRGFGDFARDNSMTVSVVSMEGTDCKLVHLGMVAQMTDGMVDIVDQSNLNDQFGNILTSRTVALDVSVTLCLHHSLYIRDKDNSTVQNSTKVQNLGNVTSGTDMIVEFGVKTASNENEVPVTIDEEDEQTTGEPVAAGAVGGQAEATMNITGEEEDEVKPGADGGNIIEQASGAQTGVDESNTIEQVSDKAKTGAGETNITEGTTERVQTGVQESNIMEEEKAGPAAKKPSELPFQMQLKFQTRDGAQYLRVVTNLRECTDQRSKAESEMDMDIVGAATSKTVSDMGLAGDFLHAKHAIKAKKKLNTRFAAGQKSESSQVGYDSIGYMHDLLDLEGMVRRQAVTTKLQLQSHSMFQHDGVTAAPPPPPRLQSDSHSHYLPDDLAKEYYDRSSHSKKKYSERMQKQKRDKK